MSSPILRVLACTALTLTAASASAQSDATRTITGTLSYKQRIALSPGADVVVEARGLRDVLLGETRFQSADAQVPLPFTLDLPAGPGATLKALITMDGQIRWLGDPVALPPGNDAVTLPDMLLASYPTGAIPTPMLCGDTPIMISFDGEATIIKVEGQVLRLIPVEAASGAKFEMPGDGTTFFWSKGDNGTLSLLGAEYPECVPAPAPAPVVYTARGNEAGWALTVTGDAFDLTRMDQDAVTGTVPTAVWQDGAVVWDIADAGILVRMTDTFCRDTMSGMPFPETVTIETADGTLTGCGGDPVNLLKGGEWLVQDIGEAGIMDDIHVSMTFGPNESVGGSGGCNRYNAGFTLTGEGLTFMPGISTMIACADAMMITEQSFHAALATVTRFDITDTGALVLFAGDGTAVITAFRT